ncbi:MAG: NifB/NifX family molybdenum-iron cluster-binding protein [Thermodesulforhabdaceae bacterium]
MKIAIPVTDGRLSMHFGHCERFAFFDVDPQTGQILKKEEVLAPPHQPGFLPQWMAQQKVDLVLAGGMGGRALGLFAQYGIRVITGAPSLEPEQIVRSYINGTLQTGANVCDHGPDHRCG